MRHFVRRIMRGFVLVLVTVLVTACSNLLQDDESGLYPTLQSEKKINDLVPIDKIRMRVARDALSNEDYDTAIRFFDAVHESAPMHPAPLVGLGEANLALGKIHEAETAYRKAVRVAPSSAAALEGLGNILVSRGAFEDAITHFNRSLAQAPSASLHNKLGVAHDLKGDGAGARRHYRAALTLDPNIVSARNNLALSLVVSEAYDEAISEMELVAAHPDATDRHRQNLAFVYGMAGRFDAASATLSENGASEADIARNQALYNRMREMAKEGDRSELLAFLRNAKPGENLSDADLTQSAAVSPDLSTAMPEAPATTTASVAPSSQETLREEDKVLPPTTLENMNNSRNNISSVPGAMSPKSGPSSSPDMTPLLGEKALPDTTKVPETKMAKLSDPAQPLASGRAVALPDVDMATGPYRIQLASYRTTQHAARGQTVLAALLKQDAEKLQVFGRKTRTDGDTGFNFRIRTTPVETRDEGVALCDAIRANGHDGCLVIKHNDNLWEPLKMERPAPKPVRVQLASFRTEKGAEKGQKILKNLLGDKVGELEILVRRSPSEHIRSFNYRIRTAPIESRDEAQRLCDAFKAAGHADCIIIQQNDSLWKTAASLGDSDHAAVATSFRVQLASYRSRKNAFAAQGRLAKLLEEQLSPSYVPTLVEYVTNAKEKLYRIFVPDVPSRLQAANLCEDLRKAGHNQCLVVTQAPGKSSSGVL